MIRLFWALPFAFAALCQQILIERVPEYSGLPGCAASPLAEIVGDMRPGCGDTGRGASHSWFCLASSTVFDAIISSAVGLRCRGEAEAASGAAQASAVFGEYCQGVNVPKTATATTLAGRMNATTGTLSCAWTPLETRITVHTATSGSPIELSWLPALSLTYFAIALSLLMVVS